MGAAAHVLVFFRSIEFNFLRRPRTPRELTTRVLIIAAMGAAAFGPFLLSTGGDDLEDVAGVEFRAALVQLETARAELAALDNDPQGLSAQIAPLEQRIAALEEQTFVGYIKREGDAPKEGALIPDFRLLDLNGDPVRLSALGKPTIVNFWASWCAFCIEEMPDLQRLQERLGDGAVVVGINRGDSLATAQRFVGETGASYTLLLDLDDDLGGRSGPYNVRFMPSTFYVRADGRIDSVKAGFHTLEEMVDFANPLLDEAITLETEPVDASFAARAADIIASQRANHAVARELFARFAVDAAVAGEIAWQRNIVAQTRAWSINSGEFQALSVPAAASAFVADVVESLRVLETAGGLLQAGIGDGMVPAAAPQIERGIELFEIAATNFNSAAVTLTEFLATQ